MRSISVLLYKAEEMTIEEIARDYNPNWMTAVEVLDDDIFIGAENSFNLFTVRRSSDAATDEERARLETVGQYHLGEFVNKFKHGSLVMKLPESDNMNFPTLIFGTVNGVIGVVATLPQNIYNILSKVQQNLTKVIKGIGGFQHYKWRKFINDRKECDAKNFLDGDLIESFLDLKIDKMNEVVKGIDISVEELTKLIENIQQATH
jgi:DNA damage-binding protein 1